MRHVLLTVVAAAAVAGCGSNSDTDSETTTTTASTLTAMTPPTESTPAVEDEAKPDKQAAIDAVRADLPDIPLYEGATYKATVIGDDKVCVDQKALGCLARRSLRRASSRRPLCGSHGLQR